MNHSVRLHACRAARPGESRRRIQVPSLEHASPRQPGGIGPFSQDVRWASRGASAAAPSVRRPFWAAGAGRRPHNSIAPTDSSLTPTSSDSRRHHVSRVCPRMLRLAFCISPPPLPHAPFRCAPPPRFVGLVTASLRSGKANASVGTSLDALPSCEAPFPPHDRSEPRTPPELARAVS